ncbi:signal transduction histidine kinase/tetratricopeptide (TPR) repeat protein [Thermonema lapsum]|uniref:histidine kinase n=1 Tax=Thermonema lapsum TaxID=28195 RepID=A0A846MPT7_9BACT|nr:tetratricopeptide repeat-containing sensor histidine kinase [Thermonema lapsum]NIK73564.1 signal transduction histidine kinase/tetratricopeptide (TPR) repeat protein [Thermonema lapsum]
MKYRLFIFVVLLALGAGLLQAQYDVDSLKQALEECRRRNDPLKEAEILKKLTVRFVANDSVQMRLYRRQLHELARRYPNNHHIQAIDAFIEAIMHHRKGEFKKAKEYYQKAESNYWRAGDSLQAAHMRMYVGNMQYELGEYARAVESFLEAQNIFEKADDKRGMGRVYKNLGNVYNDVGEYELARQYHEKSLEIDKESNDWVGVIISHNNLADAYRGLKQYDKALEHYQKYLDMAKQRGTRKGVSTVLRNMGEIYLLLQDYERAKVCFEEGWRVEQETNNNVAELSDFYLNIGRLYYHQKEYGKALTAAKGALQLAEAAQRQSLMMKANALLSDIYAKLGDYQKAYAYLRGYESIRDKVYPDDKRTEIFKMQLNYEEERRKKEAELRQKAEALATIEERQKQLILLLGGFVVFILIAAVVVIYIRYREKKKLLDILEDKSRELEAHRKEILEKNEELEAYQYVIERQNQELMKANKNLEEQVAERTHELRQSYKHLLRTKNDLDSFLYRASHDLKGPIARVLGLVNIALHDIEDPKALEYFSRIMHTAQEMDYILARLLTINNIINHEPVAEKIDWQHLIEDIFRSFDASLYKERLRWNLSVSKEAELWADVKLLRLAIENLIQNAIDYCERYQGVQVDIKILPRGQRYVHIHVIDHGMGIEEEIKDKVFDIFTKGTRSRGAGLGLYVVRLAMEHLGGHVHLKHTQAGYTEFLLSLPRVPSYMQHADSMPKTS